MDLEEVKTCLRALLSSTAFTYNVSGLLKDFRDHTGRDLPLFGCLHPVEFLKTLSDTLQLSGDPYNPEIALIKSDKSAHIISLVDRQKNKKIMNKHPAFATKQKRLIVLDKNIAFVNECKNSVLHNSQTTTASSSQTSLFKESDLNKGHKSCFTYNIKNHPQSEFQVPVKTVAPMPSILSNASNSSVPDFVQLMDKPPDVNRKNGTYFCNISDLETSVEASESNSKRSGSTSDVGEGLRNKLRKIIKKHPNGLWCCELPELFRREYNFVLDYREFGYTSLIQMVSKLPDVFRCVRPGNEDWILFDASVAPSPEEVKMMDKQSTADITCELTANVKRLLLNCFESASDSGIELDKVLELYQKMFGLRLDCHSLGFKDVKSLFRTWEGTLLNILEINGKTILEPVRKRVHLPIPWEEALPPITAENDIFAEIFPKDVIGPEEKFYELDLTRHIAVGHVVQVCVAEVWSPGKFYLQLNKFKKSLNRLMDELQKFYSVHLNKYKMPEATIRPNQVCVGLYTSDPDVPDEWHRAKIIKVINEKLVLVNFIDYGTVTRVKKNQLRFLHKSFRSFPVQGFLAQLSGVIPPNGDMKWPMSTSKKFLEILRVPYLDAEMVDIDFKIPQLSVILYDPLQKPVSSINQKLILEKLACSAKIEEYFYLQKEKLETQLKDSKSQTKGLDGYSSGVPRQETNNKNLPDEFSGIVDLIQPSLLFHFKMRSLKLENPPAVVRRKVGNKTENFNYEFDDVQNLDLHDYRKRNVEDVQEEENAPNDLFEAMESFSLPVVNREPKREISQPNQTEPFPRKPNWLPPGLEHISLNFNEIQCLVQPDLKKKINVLAMELLTANPSIKQVGLSDPSLALKIAAEMAEVYVMSEYSRNLAYNFNPMLSPFMDGFDFSFQPNAQGTKDRVPKLSSETSDLSDDSSECRPRALLPKENEYIREIRLGEKTVHLIMIDSELYFSAEEIVRKFTFMSSRETADRVLLLKKIHIDYRIITKKDEKVVKAIKSQLTVPKKKSKKLQFYLISIEKVSRYLQALGGRTQSLEDELLELQSAVSNKMIAKPELP